MKVTLAVANLVAWLLLVAFRPPMPQAYFDERDMRRRPGHVFFTSADPMAVIAERPLWSWSVFHGGEAWPVKVLEALNLPALVVAIVFHAFAGSSSVIGPQRASYMTFGILLFISTVQWYLVAMALQGLRRRFGSRASA